MAVETDLRFTVNGNVIYDPLKIVAESAEPGVTTVTIQNYSEKTLKNLGLYIKASSNVGPWDNPADYPPATDYQDLLMWGTRAEATNGVEDGGIQLYNPEDAVTPVYITKGRGSQWTSKVPIEDLLPGQNLVIKLKFIVPDDVDSRRLFINVVVE